MTELPIDSHLPRIIDALRRHRALVLVAEPGIGKTTRVPPALTDSGAVILLQPRRVAARSLARRIAEERSWTLGREVGWHIRFERRFTSDTRLLVATEGILTARLQQDPLLSGFRTVVLDEFHERSVHGDLGLALTRQAWHARDDLQIVVMSATLNAATVSAFLDNCPVITIPGRTFPLEITYQPGASSLEATTALLQATRGDVLGFLPGAAEIQRCCAEIQAAVSSTIHVLPLYGALAPGDQDRALRPAEQGARRVIVATNIAETSMTVPGVTAVFDSGLQKVARYDARRGIDSLVTERITADAAEQRAGRAGRLAPGIAWRLWDPRDRLRPAREPEIHRVDLCSPVLDILAWGGDPARFDWFEVPRPEAVDAALRLLVRLGAIADGKLTAIGRTMQRLPLHPRLARILLEGSGDVNHARACALLAENIPGPVCSSSTTSDLLSALDAWNEMPARVQQTARDIEQLARSALAGMARTRSGRDERAFRRAVLAGYPDRVAQRRDPQSARVRLAAGPGGRLDPSCGVREAEFLVAVDLQASTHPQDPDARVRLASRVEREWLQPTGVELVHRLEPSGTVRAVELVRYDALILAERPAAVDPATAADLLSAAYLAQAPSEEDQRLLRRIRFAGRQVDVAALAHLAARGARTLADVHLGRVLPLDVMKAIARDAPDTVTVPSGRAVRLEYEDDGGVKASVKLQELFGWAATPRIGPRQVPVLIALLAPNGRPVQLTRDLRSFWERTYPEVRKELRGRYPKHPWPEDPTTATPTARAAGPRSR